jgi:hypothetical protein
MSLTTIINSSPLPQLPTMHRRNFSLNSITNSIMPPSTTTPTANSQTTNYTKPLFDVESFAYISLIKALQNTPTISHTEMLMIKEDIITRLRAVTGSIKNSRLGEMRVIPKGNGQIPLVLPLAREILRKVVVPVNEGRESRWVLREEFQHLKGNTRDLSDSELLLQIRAVLSGTTSSTPLSRSEAAKVAEFVAHALPENFALSRRQILQLISFTSFLDGSGEEGKLRLGEMRRALEGLGQNEVVRLLKLGESDGASLELLRLRLGDVRR